jgi:hypothetical protein
VNVDKIIGAIGVAGAILKKAADFVQSFLVKNTPESAVLAAIAFAYQQYQAGTINGTQFAFAVISALVVFTAAEANKDKNVAAV